MPVEIRELTVRVSVNPPNGEDVTPGSELTGSSSEGVDERQTLKAEIIEECVERVLAILDERHER